jgi:hypothetical protein
MREGIRFKSQFVYHLSNKPKQAIAEKINTPLPLFWFSYLRQKHDYHPERSENLYLLSSLIRHHQPISTAIQTQAASLIFLKRLDEAALRTAKANRPPRGIHGSPARSNQHQAQDVFRI